MADLTAIILAFNEELHLRRCIVEARKIASHIIVVDSGSTDSTVQIAQELDATVLSHHWVNHATQFNWALKNAPVMTEWVMRIDADEYVDAKLCHAIRNVLSDSKTTDSGFAVDRYIRYQGKIIKFGGGISPGRVVRIWRHGQAMCEDRWMDEHMIVNGTCSVLRGALVDDNKNTLSWWIQKHDGYSNREAVELLNLQYRFLEPSSPSPMLRYSAKWKRLFKNKIYSRLPSGLRAGMYFLYRFVIRGGVLDGPTGWQFHFLQGFWYRLVVDLKVSEVKKMMRNEHVEVTQAILRVLKIDVSASRQSSERARKA